MITRNTLIRQIVFMLALTFLYSTALNAQIFFDGSPETDAPPPTLGGFTMVPFEEDNRDLFVSYPDVPLPTPYTGDLGFTPDLNHRKIGIGATGWSTWSHGYTGSVYFTGMDVNSMTFTLPPKTYAFYFYAQPNDFNIFNIEAIGEAGSRSSVSSGQIPVDGDSGAKYFGFYTEDEAVISQIVVTADAGANGFGVGEFGIFSEPPPVPLSNWALCLGTLLMITFVVIRFRRIF